MTYICSIEVCSGRVQFGGLGCYEVISIPDGVSWYDASIQCTDNDTQLLAIESQEENDAVRSYLEQNEGKWLPFCYTIPSFNTLCSSTEPVSSRLWNWLRLDGIRFKLFEYLLTASVVWERDWWTYTPCVIYMSHLGL